MTSTRCLLDPRYREGRGTFPSIFFFLLPRELSYRLGGSEREREERPEKGGASRVEQIKATRRYDQRGHYRPFLPSLLREMIIFPTWRERDRATG